MDSGALMSVPASTYEGWNESCGPGTMASEREVVEVCRARQKGMKRCVQVPLISSGLQSKSAGLTGQALHCDLPRLGWRILRGKKTPEQMAEPPSIVLAAWRNDQLPVTLEQIYEEESMKKLTAYASVALVAALASLLIQGFVELTFLPRFVLTFGVIGLSCYISYSLLRVRPGNR